MTRVSVLQYKGGNIHNVYRALEHVGADVALAASAADVRDSGHLLLPGVGAFGAAMDDLSAAGLVEPIREHVRAGKPFLGVCVGMQLLASESEEFGVHQGLDLIPGRVTRIPDRSTDGSPLKVPHVGWSSIEPSDGADWTNTILASANSGDSTYFVHSFVFYPEESGASLAECCYGGHRLTAAVTHENCFGLQFHPEKSGEAGLKMLSAFLAR